MTPRKPPLAIRRPTLRFCYRSRSLPRIKLMNQERHAIRELGPSANPQFITPGNQLSVLYLPVLWRDCATCCSRERQWRRAST